MKGIDPQSIDAILLDIDGTIADTDDAIVSRIANWLRHFRWLLPGRDLQRVARRITMRIESPVNAMVAWLDRTGLDQVLGPLIESLQHLRGTSSRSHTHLVPGVEAALLRLAETYPLGIVTAREHRSAHAFLEWHGLDPFFQCVATARTCRRAKPHPAPVLWAVDQLGVSPARCLMVGDTTADILAGNAAGVGTVGVLCGFGERNELEAAGADILLPSTTDLPAFLLDARV